LDQGRFAKRREIQPTPTTRVEETKRTGRRDEISTKEVILVRGDDVGEKGTSGERKRDATEERPRREEK